MNNDTLTQPPKVATAISHFKKHFDKDAQITDLTVVRAPGRVNLIGEHTDYNDGFVFPMAIDREIIIVGRSREDSQVKLYSVEYDQQVEFHVGRVEKDGQAPWTNYFRGVVDLLQQAGHRLRGLEAVLVGDVPQGAGLSSSAAFEVATATLLDRLFHLELDPIRKVLLCRQAENEFVGVACGIMDPFISGLGKAGHGLFLDCRTLEYEYVPLHLSNAAVVVANSNKRRDLVDSEYNTRRRECEEGAAYFAEHLPGVRALRDVTVKQFEALEAGLPQPIRNRCRHVVHECARVLKSVDALRANDLAAFGQLMNASHDSLRDDYEVSCNELDVIVDAARSMPGVYGARMTGGGFGGCVVILVKRDAVDSLSERIAEEYPRRTGLKSDIYVFTAVDGAGVMTL